MNSYWAIVVLGSVVSCVYFNQQMGAVHWICFVENLFLNTFLLFFPCFKFFASFGSLNKKGENSTPKAGSQPIAGSIGYFV